MLLMIDNYDSFTYNLVQYFAELGADITVIKNDQLTIAQIWQLRPQRIVISPGPCTPDDAGISLSVVTAFLEHIPILGVCLGHQCIAQALGGQVVRARQVMHGKTSLIHHAGANIFARLPNPFVATRYHSLVVKPDQLPECLTTTAWTLDEDAGREIMGIAHVDWPVVGVQFHPESILSEQGHQLLQNFLNL